MNSARTCSIYLFGKIFFVLLLCPLFSNAQSYPVQLTTQLVPPFSGYITDYASPGNENLRLLILFTDFSRAAYDVKLKLKIQGQGITIQSKSWYFSGPVTLQPGVPQLLSGSDLAGLLNENNLDFTGITRQDYDAHKVLPEGFYTITVTAYDFQNPIPIQVSNEATAQAWMMLNDPPFLNLPSCNSSVPPTSPQQLTFSWACMNLFTPFSLGTEYTFEIWEIFPANQSAGNIVASTAPIFSITTSQSFFNYGITEPPLVVGREYVWRVRARDLENRELFRNNGNSPLCTFHYGSNLELLGNIGNITLHAQAITHRQARCWWDSIGVYTTYRLEFRKVGGVNWFPFLTNHASMNIPDLEPNSDYEAHVTGITSEGEEGPMSNVVTWHTSMQPVFNCGESSPPPASQNFHPLTQANAGMIWQVGQFEMEVVSLNGNSNALGWYSGLGKVVMPMGWTVNCSFANVQIGDDHVLYAGEVRAVTDGISNWLTQFNQSQFHYDTSYFYNGTIDSLYVNENGDVVIIDANGNTTIVDIDTHGGALFTDSNGNQWIVNDNGTITFVTGGFLLPITNDTLNAQEMRILKLAMTDIRNQLSDHAIEQQKNLKETKQADLGNYIAQQKQSLPTVSSYSGTTTSDSTEFVTYYEIPVSPNDQGAQLGSSYKEAEINYYASQVLKVFSREDAPDMELNFIGQYLTVNGMAYKQFVAQQLAQGRTENQIAADVAENGVKQLVHLVLLKQMSKE